ncbi:MAG TPA: tetraacyldisaccharide 4'-kinase [bacterium]
MSLERIISGLFYKKESLFLKLILFPFLLLSYVYFLVVITKNLFYRYGIFKKQAVGAFVISVGNLTVGGTAKTPAVIAVGRFIEDSGLKAGVVTKGYRRLHSEDIFMDKNSDGEFNPQLCGDEPIVILRNLTRTPVYTGKNKTSLAISLFKRFNPDVIIIDDGFSHLKLHRDLNILMVDGRRMFGNSRLLPRGPLREPLSSFSRANAVIIKNDADTTTNKERIKHLAAGIPLFTMEIKPSSIRKIADDSVLENSGTENFVAFCGIADPDSFRRTLLAAGISPLEFIEYDDHAEYNEKIIMKMDGLAKNNGAKYAICSEKDAVKIKRYLHAGGKGIIYCYLKIEPVIEKKFFEFLNKAINNQKLLKKGNI